MFQTLLTILNKELALYKEIAEVVEKQTDIIKKGDIEGLNELLKTQQKYVTSITVLEEERQKELARIFPGKRELPTITDCIEMAVDQEKVQLSKVYENLMSVLQKIREINELNQQLLEQSLEFVNFSMNLLRPQKDNLNYGPPNKKQLSQPMHTSSVFNTEV